MNKYVLTGIFVVAFFFILNRFKKPTNANKIVNKNGMEEPKYFFKIEPTGNLQNDFVRFLKLKEGGLSRDVNDSASKTPSPYRLKDKSGVYQTGWHTNKGITYATFKSAAKELGFEDNEKNFAEMPDAIWYKIFANKYYKPFKNLTSSEIINLYVSTWAWGSGVGGANSLLKKIGEDLQTLIDKVGVNETLKFLVKERIKFYERLVKAKPQNAKFLQGWKNVALSFYKNFSPYAKN